MADYRETGIFLLHEGLKPTILESQVLAHVAAMRGHHVSMDVWSFALTRSSYNEAKKVRERLERDHEVVIKLYRGVRPAVPGSLAINSLLFVFWLIRNRARPGFVHARTDYSTTVAATAKRYFRYRLIWDARGDTLSEFLADSRTLPSWKRLFVPLKVRRIRRQLKRSAAYCDRAIFVSSSLRQLQGSCLGPDRVTILPCVASERRFYFDNELRRSVRDMLGLSRDDILLVYSGSTSAYQCVSETMELFNDSLSRSGRVHALVVSPTPEQFLDRISAGVKERVHLRTATLAEMNGYLNAADFGVMLRKVSPINEVASPVKFAEYSLVGLKVVTGSAVSQVCEFGSRIGNLVDMATAQQEILRWHGEDADRARRAAAAAQLLGRSVYSARVSRIYQ